MLTKSQETGGDVSLEEEPLIDIDGMLRAADATVISARPTEEGVYGHTLSDNFNLSMTRYCSEIGKVLVAGWEESENGATIGVVGIEDFYTYDTYNNHSAYLAILRQIAEQSPNVARIEGLPTNEMAAVVLDLDTFGVLPEGWRVIYYLEHGSDVIKLQYPLEVYDLIKAGVPVFHNLEYVSQPQPSE